MKSLKPIFYQPILIAIAAVFTIMSHNVANGASVVSRTPRPNNASRMPTLTTTPATTALPQEPVVNTNTDITTDTPDVDNQEQEIIVNKSSTFDSILGDTSIQNTDSADNALAEQIRAQRAALDASSAATALKTIAVTSAGKNECDTGLRACIQAECGSDFSKCAGDTATTWGSKLDACRRNLPCTGEEYRLFTTEITADRDMNAQISSYTKIVECGNEYNNCILSECGKTFDRCLGKKYGDAALSKCEKIAQKCHKQDTGLVSRMTSVFGTLRSNAEKTVQQDQERLYNLRDAMKSACAKLGAMFDERTLDCVYTVNFYAGDQGTLYASKKAYAGSTFNCAPDWFGVDITTFKENAMRLTREQKSATSALMGSGIGMATGAITSGAIDRAIDRHNAEGALDDAKKEHEEIYKNNNDTTQKITKQKTTTSNAGKSHQTITKQKTTTSNAGKSLQTNSGYKGME